MSVVKDAQVRSVIETPASVVYYHSGRMRRWLMCERAFAPIAGAANESLTKKLFASRVARITTSDKHKGSESKTDLRSEVAEHLRQEVARMNVM